MKVVGISGGFQSIRWPSVGNQLGLICVPTVNCMSMNFSIRGCRGSPMEMFFTASGQVLRSPGIENLGTNPRDQ